MKPRIFSTGRLSLPFATAIAALLGSSHANAQTSFTDTATGAWNTARWNNTADAVPYTSAFTDNNAVNFTTGTYNIAGMGAVINVGNVTLSDNVTVNFTAASSTYATGGLVRTIDVGTNSTYNMSTQAVSTAAGTGFIKSGAGTWVTAGNTYAGGFTLNSGTVALAGVNGMGSGGALTINGGTIRSNGTAARDLTGKYTGGITIGGNFTLGDAVSNGALTFTNTVNLGAANRTITVNSAATFGTAAAVFSGAAGVGFTKNGAGTLRLNAVNTLTGVVEVSEGILQIGSYTGLNTASSLTVSGGGTSNLQLIQVGTGTTTNSINKALSLHGTLSIGGGSATNRLNQTWAGNITLAGDSRITNNGNSLFDIDGQIDLGAHILTYQADGTGSRIDGNIVGVGGSLIKTSAQGLLLAGANTYSGATTISAGTLTLNYATQDNSKLSDTAALTLGGNIILDGATGSHVEVVGSTTLTAGTASGVTRSGANSATLQLGTITNNFGAAINFGTAGLATTNNLNNSQGILGSWATITGDGWAVNSTNGANGLITGATYTDVTRLDSGTKTIASGPGHTRIIEGTGLVGDITMAASGITAVNTLVNAATTAGTVDIGTGNTLGTSAILQVTGAGALTVGISATPGTLTALTAGGDLSVVANAAITINSTISDNTSASTLTKLGSGTLTLSGDNDYSGATNVNLGTLSITHNNALGSTVGSTTIHGGRGTTANGLSLTSATSDLTIAENINVFGNLAGRAQVDNNSAQNHTLTGAIDVSSDTNLSQFNSNGSGSIAISGDITGTLSNGAVLFLRGTSTSALNRVIGSVNLTGGNLAKTDAGTWLVGAAGETYSWVNTLHANGRINLGAANVLPSSSVLLLGENAARTPTLDLNGFDQTIAGITYNSGTGTRTITNSDAVNAAVITINNATDNVSGLTNTNTIALTGNLGLTKEGAGMLTLLGTGTSYSGATTISDGTLALSDTTNFASAVSVNAGTTLQYSPTGTNSQNGVGAISLLGSMTYAPAVNGFQTVGTPAGNKIVTVSGGDSVINISPGGPFAASTGGLYLDGGLQGSSDLTVNATTNGFGLVLRTAGSTYSGTMTVNGTASTTAGTGSGLVIGFLATSASAATLPNANLTINGTLELGNSNLGMGWAAGTTANLSGQTFGMNALDGTGVIVANMLTAASTRTISVGNNGGSGNFSGVIADGVNNTLSFTKEGNGTQTLSGTNTYTGATTISGGTLLINGNSSTATGAVNVNAGTLGGTATVGGAISVASGAILSPGASIESLAAPSLSMASGSIFTYEVADNSSTGADLLALSSTLSLSGVTLNLDAATLAALGGGGWSIGNKLTLISYLGADITSGFTGYNDDTSYFFGSNEWLFDYNDTDAGGNYGADATAAGQNRFVTMTVIPEPSAALLGGLGLLALLRRRR